MPSTKRFDVDEALDRAMETFWEHGYKATSMCTLLDGMGIQKGSFYATFFFDAPDVFSSSVSSRFNASRSFGRWR